MEDIQTDERVSLHLDVRERQSALEALAAALVEANPRLELAQVFESLMAREIMATTGIGDGVAVPHARMPGLVETQLVLATCPEGLEYGAIDGQPVRILVGVLTPDDEPAEGIRALSDVARCLRDPAVRASLVDAQTTEEVIAVLRGRALKVTA